MSRSNPSARPTPVIIGVGDVVNRSVVAEDAIEPKDLIQQAIETALKDTGLASNKAVELRSAIDSISVVASWTWPYPDLPGLLSRELRIDPYHTSCSPHGGNQPGKLFDEAARRISLGKTKVALLAGGEALASC